MLCEGVVKLFSVDFSCFVLLSQIGLKEELFGLWLRKAGCLADLGRHFGKAEVEEDVSEIEVNGFNHGGSSKSKS